MENRNIIIVLVVIVIILAVVAGVMFFQSNAKEPSMVKITSDKTQYGDGELAIRLTSLDKTAISKEKVNVVIKNSKGKVVLNKTVKTNSKGKAKLDFDLKKGKYVVNVNYGGNENYSGNDTTQNLTIKQKVTKSIESHVNEYPNYMEGVGYYKTLAAQEEDLAMELADGRQVVLTGDGIYEYLGLDSNGNIQWGNEITV